MSYTPTSWNTGDTITAAKLNKLEQGVADAGLLVTLDNNLTFDKTYNDVVSKLAAGGCVVLKYSETSYGMVKGVWVNAEEGTYTVDDLYDYSYITTSPDGFPAPRTSDPDIEPSS